MNRAQRLHRLAQILQERVVPSQAELTRLLREEGFNVTQGTVCRDLEELGAIKVRLPGGGSTYVLPVDVTVSAAPLEQLEKVLKEWVVSVERSHHLIVVRTRPGSAHVVGSAIDRATLPAVAGTVAGDDTLLVVTREGYSARDLEADLLRLADLSTSKKEGEEGTEGDIRD